MTLITIIKSVAAVERALSESLAGDKQYNSHSHPYSYGFWVV